MRDKQAEIRTIDLKTKSLEIAIAKGLPDFKASNGYLRGFYDRYNIQCKSLHGEAGSVDSSTVIEWFTKVNNIIKVYENKDVYNLDETGLFYKAERGKSFVTGKESANSNLRGVKQSKERLTVLVGASMIGEKLPLLVIGKSVNPYCFRNVSSLPAIYRSQPSAWMDQIIFLEYLNKLDKRFETEKRKCIVFIDNCRAHPPQDNLKHMKALKVVFFPPNITSVCQPMDMGIIANLKGFYKTYLSREKNLVLNNNMKFTCTVLDAMCRLSKSWKDVKESTIVNCFTKANFNRQDDLVPQIIELQTHSGPPEEFDDDNIPICNVDSTDPIINFEIDKDDNEDDDVPIIKASTALQHFVELSRYLINSKIDPVQVNDLKDLVYAAIENNLVQTKITQFTITK